MTEALLLEGVTKRYADHTAVRDLSLSVPTGIIYGILGPNGAGKSTTLRMAMNIIARDEGRIVLAGADPAHDRGTLRRVGYLPEERGLYRKMKVIDVIVFFAALKGVPETKARAEGVEWLERMGLGEWAGARVDTLSKGMQQKVQFITTVLHDPEVLILDEPFSGLDPVNQEVLRDTVLRARAEGRTVILSTHNMDQAQGLCENVCIIANGRKILDGRLDEVRRAHRGNRYFIEFDAPTADAERFMMPGRHFARVDRSGKGWHVELASGTEPPALLGELGALDVPLRKYEHVEPTLHEIFVEHVGAAAAKAGRGEG